MEKYFSHNQRLGIDLPDISQPLSEYNADIQDQILFHWETIRGKIPDRIKEIEVAILKKQSQLNKEENFQNSCILNSEISEMASIINDLWIWYRFQQRVSKSERTAKSHKSEK